MNPTTARGSARVQAARAARTVDRHAETASKHDVGPSRAIIALGTIGKAGINMSTEVVCGSCSFNYTKSWPPQLATLAQTFNICAHCGALMPWTLDAVTKYYELVGVQRTLPIAARLVTKSEFVAAIRESTVSLEELVRRSASLNARGADLMDQAFRFEYDRAAKRVVRVPHIQINNLRTESKRSEQDGIRLLAMGVMRGVRNIFAHGSEGTKLSHSLNIITTVCFIMDQIIGSDGTVAEDRSIFRTVIPLDHDGHSYSLGAFQGRGMRRAFCNDCKQEFCAESQPITRD